MLFLSRAILILVALVCSIQAFAAPAGSELQKRSSHRIEVINNCGSPTSIQIPGLLEARSPGVWTYDHDVRAGIAQACADINGVGCTSVEFTLDDLNSTADITLIPPHKFDHPASFTLSNGQAASCNSANCGKNNAFYKTDDYTAQRYDPNNPNSGITIIFC